MPNPKYDNIIKYYKDNTSYEYAYKPSRYDQNNCIIDEDGDTYRATYESVTIPKKTTDHYYVVEPPYENRLDLIAYKFYKSSLLYWVIAEASDLVDPFELPVGTLLRIPDYQSLYGIQGIL